MLACLTVEQRPYQRRNGDVELRRYEQSAKVLRIDIGDETFNESTADVAYILDHFELPDPGDLATRFPADIDRARGELRCLADAHGFTFKRSEQEDWQIEDLARLVVKRSGILGSVPLPADGHADQQLRQRRLLAALVDARRRDPALPLRLRRRPGEVRAGLLRHRVVL